MALKLKTNRPEIPRQRSVHPSKPVWWTRTKNDDGTWSAVPHYGKRMTKHIPGKGWV